MNIQMVQNVLLIWLDGNIDEDSADCRNTITQLRRAVHTNINKYTDDEQCIDFLVSIEDDKACMVISGSLGQYMVPQVHNDMFQVDSIFISLWKQEVPRTVGQRMAQDQGRLHGD